MRITPTDLANIDRELARRSLAEFAKMAWDVLEPATDLKWGWALDAICEHLEAVTNGEIKRLLINVPPGCMKSLLVGVIWPAWEWGPQGKPSLRIMGTSFKQDLANRDNLKCRRLITSAWYQSLWPLALTSDQNAKTKFENNKTGFRESMAFKSMTGSRGDRVILDDPLSADDANSPAALEAARITFTEALPTRVNNENSAIVVIMQRLHERDTSGIILDLGLKYDHLMLPMHFEANRRCSTVIGFTDPRKVDGELLFPERFPVEQVDELIETLGPYATSGQLQQRPSPRGGGILKTEWWDIVPEVPALVWRSLYADTAQKTKEANDYSVLQCWGATRDGRAIMLDQVRGKWEAPELLTHARAFWAKHKTMIPMAPLRAFNIEDKVSGTGLIQTLARESIPVVAVQRDRDKITRAYDIAPQLSAGNVMLHDGGDWLSGFLSEAEAFPNGAHDDQIDPAMDAITDMLYRTLNQPQLRAL